MIWFKKTADRGHQNTMDGQLYKKKLVQLTKRLRVLLTAADEGLDAVLPRWSFDVKRAILLLPKEERVSRMSMSELREIEKKMNSIETDMSKYSTKRFKEIVEGGLPCQ